MVGGDAQGKNSQDNKYKFDAEEANRHLGLLWDLYSSPNPIWYEIRIINSREARSYWFRNSRECVQWLEKWWDKLQLYRKNVFYGVLPREKFSEDELGEKGKPRTGGKSKHVDRALFVFADLDYKKEETPPKEIKEIIDEQGYHILKDSSYTGELELWVRQGEKYIHITRPPLSVIVSKVKELLGTEPSLIIDSGYGYHVYVKLIYDIDVGKWRRLQELFITVLGGDTKTKNPDRVLRVAGSWNPRYYNIGLNRPVKIVYTSLSEIDPDELLKKLEEAAKQRVVTTTISGTSTGRSRYTLRLLKDSEILKVKELLKIIYKPGQRQLLSLYLAGWGAHSRVHPVSIAQVIKMLHEETSDEDKLEQRLSVIPYSYKKANLWSSEVERDFLLWLQAIGVNKVYGLSSSIQEEAVKGKGGVFELLVQSLGSNEEAEAKANEILRQLSEVFNRGKFDLVCELVDYEKQLYVCAHLKRKVIARMKRKEDKLVFKEKVFPIVPAKVVLYVDPVNNSRKFELEVVGDERILPKPVRVGPAEPLDLVAWLKARGLCYHSRLAEDVLNAVLNAYLKRQIAEVREEIDKPGFYLVDNRIIAIRWDLNEINREELKEALTILNELAEKWYSHVADKFSVIIKWGIIAPFIYAMKQKGKWVQWLYLYGASYTGKSTLGEIILAIWGLEAGHRRSGATIDTPARIGYVLSQSTFPTLVNEPGNAILREDVVELMKSAIESPLARGKYIRGSYVEIPSLSPLIITSNRVLPRDDALLRRFIVLSFTFGERIDPAKAKEFDREIKPILKKLAIIGHYVARRIIEDPKMLDTDWLELTEKLLEEAYREAGLQIPSWIRLRAEHNPAQVYDDMREAIRNFLVKRINEEYNRFVGRIEVVEQVEEDSVIERRRFLPRHDVTFSERVRIVLEAELIPWMMLRGDELLITSGFIEELRKVIGDVGGLKSIAELLGWVYRKKISLRVGKRVTSASCIVVSLNELLEFLQPEEVVTLVFYKVAEAPKQST